MKNFINWMNEAVPPPPPPVRNPTSNFSTTPQTQSIELRQQAFDAMCSGTFAMVNGTPIGADPQDLVSPDGSGQYNIKITGMVLADNTGKNFNLTGVQKSGKPIQLYVKLK